MAQPNTLPPGNYGFGQATAIAFNGADLLNSGDDESDLISQRQYRYLNQVLAGASPMHIVDHGVGPFEDKTSQFPPRDFGVICIMNVCGFDSTSIRAKDYLNLLNMY